MYNKFEISSLNRFRDNLYEGSIILKVGHVNLQDPVDLILHFSLEPSTVASLGLMSPGAANKGVTPFFPQNLTTFFCSSPLSIWQFHLFHAGVTPSMVSLRPFLPLPPYFSLSFVNLAHIFSSGCQPPGG